MYSQQGKKDWNYENLKVSGQGFILLCAGSGVHCIDNLTDPLAFANRSPTVLGTQI